MSFSKNVLLQFQYVTNGLVGVKKMLFFQ